MSRGLSKQQKRILAMLKTKLLVKSDRWFPRGYFSTQEVVIEFNWDYRVWLDKAEKNPWGSNRKTHIDYPKYDKIRMSVYRALRSLEKRGLIVSFTHWNERFWAVPERLEKHGFGSLDWVKEDEEWRESRSECWKWGAFIRTLPRDLHIKYKLRITKKEDVESIKKLWKEYRISSGNRV